MKAKRVWLAAALAAQFPIQTPAATPESGAGFTRITTGPIVTEARNSTGCTWTDYNNDGLLDMFVCHDGGRPSLFLNNGSAGFTQISEGPHVNDVGQYPLTPSFGDFDNDDFPDLFVSNYNAPSLFYQNDRRGSFTRITDPAAAGFVTLSGLGIGGAWADFDNDGHLDLFIGNGGLGGSYQDWLFRNRGNGTFERLATAVPAQESRATMWSSWSDIDNDGDLDLYVAHDNQANSMFLNNGNGTFTKQLTGPHVTDVARHFCPSWADYDNDGDLDLFVLTAHTPQANRFYRNNGGGSFERLTIAGLTTIVADTLIATWGDYDNDGFLDVFISDRASGPNQLFRNRGDGSFEQITTAGGPGSGQANSAGCAWGDYDNDGFLDLYVANGEHFSAQQNFLYRNEGNRNHWLKLRCLGTVSNRSAIGARIRARATIGGAERWFTREISSGAGAGQDFPFVHLGLGDATSVDLLEILWPSGTIQRLENVSADQILRVVEPSRVSVATDGVTIHGGRLRGHRLERSPDLENWSPLGVHSTPEFHGRVQIDRANAQSDASRAFFRSVATDVSRVRDVSVSAPHVMAIDGDGAFYLRSCAGFDCGVLVKASMEGDFTPVPDVPSITAGPVADSSGRIYVATQENGSRILRIDANGGITQLYRFAGDDIVTEITQIIPHSDGSTFLITRYPSILKLSAAGTLSVWVDTGDMALSGVGPACIRGNDLLVAYRADEIPSIVRFPIQADGSAGPRSVFARDQRLQYLNGMALDSFGNVYVGSGERDIHRIHRDGRIETLIDQRDGIRGAIAPVFGRRVFDRGDLYFLDSSYAPGGLSHIGKVSLGLAGN